VPVLSYPVTCRSSDAYLRKRRRDFATLAVATAIPGYASMQFESCRSTRSEDKRRDFDLLRASLSRDYISRLTPPGKSHYPVKYRLDKLATCVF
jgi:hypothetical protein